MSAPPPSAKGTVPFREFETWYRVTGDLSTGATPLVVLHGGPGSTHDYLAGLAWLSDNGTPVIHYDQLGNGGSTHLRDRDPSFWTVELFLAELTNLLDQLGVAGDHVLLGHSWGGVLGALHAADRPPGLRGLIVADAPASYPMWLEELEVLRKQLPEGVNETLLRHERAGTTGSDEYYAAATIFYNQHLCRLSPWPREYQASFYDLYDNPSVYFAMNGPTEFHVTGPLRELSLLDRLPDIAVPTLVISGRHDEVTPGAVRPYQELIPGARWEIFEDSSHVPHLEEPERFLGTVSAYLMELA